MVRSARPRDGVPASGPREAASRVALVYLAFGALFIAASELVVASLESASQRVAVRLSFVTLSAVLLVVLIQRAMQSRREAEARLEQAQRLEAMGQLAGGIAHDFNNLLTVILGYSELATGRLPEGDPVRDDLAAVQRAGEHARQLADQLLTVSRRRVVEPVPVDPGTAVSSLAAVLTRLVGQGITVEVDATESGAVLIDPGQLEQIVLNLVVNARDAMPDGGALRIAIAGGRMPDGRRAVQLTVADTGEGMDADTMARCFEPFFTTRTRSDGTGLGLATVWAIATQAGGEVHVESERGRGTTFTISLPTIEDAVVDLRAAPSGHGGVETVLLAEDDDIVREFTQRVLAGAGYEVIAVASGRAAIAALDRGLRPDVVVSDVVMPDGGGVELATALARRSPATPVLFVSGFADDERLHDDPALRGIPMLTKPYRPGELLDAVRAALGAAARAQGSKR